MRFNRRNIFLRDRHKCQYCGHAPGKERLSLDHVTPRSRGGRSVWTNVVTACTDCNARKGNRMPEECGMRPRVAPKRPSWLASLRIDATGEQRHIWSRFVGASLGESLADA